MSRLLNNSDEFRRRELSRNTYTNNDNYEVGNPNALSDGDEKGKGELNGSIGGATDIAKRQESLARNKFNKNNEYDITAA
jgi:hypothetical protein